MRRHWKWLSYHKWIAVAQIFYYLFFTSWLAKLIHLSEFYLIIRIFHIYIIDLDENEYVWWLLPFSKFLANYLHQHVIKFYWIFSSFSYTTEIHFLQI